MFTHTVLKAIVLIIKQQQNHTQKKYKNFKNLKYKIFLSKYSIEPYYAAI